jgi:cytochrome c-type biogenesis protein CcmE
MSSPAQGGNADPRVTGISKGAQIALGALLAAFLLGWYGYTNLAGEATYRYYQTLAELRSAGAPPPGQSLRVHGYVASDSIRRDLESRQVHFQVQNDPPHAAISPSPGAADPLRVVYQGLETPDLFKDGAEVVVEGHLQGLGSDAIFVADNVLAKCPSKFQAKLEGEPL